MRQITEGKGTSKIALSPAEQDALRRAAKARRRHTGRNSHPSTPLFVAIKEDKIDRIIGPLDEELKLKLREQPGSLEVASFACELYGMGNHPSRIEHSVHKRFDETHSDRAILIGLRAFRAELTYQLTRENDSVFA